MHLHKKYFFILFLLPVFFGAGNALSQKQLIKTEFPVNDVVISSSKKEAWFTSGTKIFRLDLEKFKLLDSVQLGTDPFHTMTSITYTDTKDDILEVKSQYVDFTRFPSREYPTDTTYYYNISGGVEMAKITGNALMTNLLPSSGFVFGWNDFFKSENNGEEVYLSYAGGLSATINGDNKNPISAEASGVLEAMILTPDGKYLILVYYNEYSEGEYKYQMEVRSFPNLQIQKSISFNTFYIDDLFLSENQKYAGIKVRRYSKAKENVYSYLFFTIPDLTPLNELPKDFQHGESIYEGKLWVMEEGNIVLRDFTSENKLKEIWPNLTPLWSINGFEVIDSNRLLIYGEGSPVSGITGGSQGLFQYNIEDNAVYSDVGPENTEEKFFDPEEMKLLDNRFSLSNDYRAGGIHGNTEKLLISSGNKVQLWNSKQGKKLEEWLLDNASRNFLSEEGKSVLFFEENKGQTSDEFQIGVLDLSTGIARKRIYSGAQEFSPVNPSCECYEQTGEVWICAGGNLETGIWRITLSDLQIEKIKDFADPQYDYTSIVNFQAIPGTSNFIFHLKKENFNSGEEYISSPGIFSLEDNSFRYLNFPHQISAYFPLGKEEMIYQSGNVVSQFNFSTQESTKLYDLAGYNLVDQVSFSNPPYSVFAPDNPSEDFLVVPAGSNNLTQSFKLPFTSRFFFSGSEGIIHGSSDNIFTYYPQHRLNLSWNEGEPIYLDNTSLSMDNSGNILFDSNRLIDLKTLELETISDLKHSSILLPDGRVFRIMEERYSEEKPFFTFQILNREDYSKVEWESERLPMDFYSPEHLVSSPDGKYIICYYNIRYADEHNFFIIDTESGTVSKKELQNQVLNVLFSPDGESLYVSETSSSFGKANWSVFRSGDLQMLTTELPFNPEAIISNDKFLIRNPQGGLEISTFQNDGMTREKSFFSRSLLTKAGYDPGNKLVYAGNQEGDLILWDEEISSPLKEFDLGSSQIISVLKSNNKLFVLLKEGKLGIIDLVSRKLLATLTVFQKRDKEPTLAWMSPDGYFKAGKNDIRNFHFVKGGKAFPLVNYEIFLNRPDLLMEKLGYANPEIVQIYKEAYEKRLIRNNISFDKKSFLQESFSLSLSENNNIPAVTDERFLQLEINAPEEAREIKAYINGVPVYSALAKKKQTLDLVLNSGENNINIIGLTDRKVESYPISISITSTFEAEPQIHYFGVGVSTYEDASMNLNYADIDVKKMASTFELKYDGRVKIDTLLNTSVTKNNLQLLKEKLRKTKVDDIVILSFSGHGLVDDNNDFYFATHDVDFDKPQEKGFSFDDIHELLNGIPARKKLLLIDACNSGEIDSSEDLEPIALHDNVKQHIPEGVRGSKVVKSDNSKGLQDSFEVMKSLFYDLDRGNGAYIIAAAGGREFAYESDEWDNGVFTYSFLKALQDLGYEWGGGEKPIKISNIKNYVEDQVVKLTNGKQQPTARSENIEWDWELE